MENIKVSGMFTHLCCPDSRLPDDIAFTRGQIDQFYKLVDHLKKTVSASLNCIFKAVTD